MFPIWRAYFFNGLVQPPPRSLTITGERFGATPPPPRFRSAHLRTVAQLLTTSTSTSTYGHNAAISACGKARSWRNALVLAARMSWELVSSLVFSFFSHPAQVDRIGNGLPKHFPYKKRVVTCNPKKTLDLWVPAKSWPPKQHPQLSTPSPADPLNMAARYF